MSNINIRLLYQQHSGMGLDVINKLVEDPQTVTDAQCPECGELFQEGAFANQDLIKYTEWLEEELELALSVGERLLVSHNLLLGNEESEPGQ